MLTLAVECTDHMYLTGFITSQVKKVIRLSLNNVVRPTLFIVYPVSFIQVSYKLSEHAGVLGKNAGKEALSSRPLYFAYKSDISASA